VTLNVRDASTSLTVPFATETDPFGTNNTERVGIYELGTFHYAAGTTTGTVDIPSTALLKRVSVIANAASSTTVTIGGGATVTIPATMVFDETIPGKAVGADVVIGGGAPQSYYVAWTT
jgi:hypothetical protein